MKIDIITIFPNIFDSYFNESIIKRAKESGHVEINTVNLRDFTTDPHQSVDDKPFGGGPGMVMMIEPIHKAIESLRNEKSFVIGTSAKGRTYKQSVAHEYSKKEHLIILCGHYGGYDHRVDELLDESISIGDYVLTGGEIPAMVMVDSVTRLLPGVLGNDTSASEDSFYSDDKSIQYPIYTRPAEYEINGRIVKVPDILLSGNHKKIEDWRKEQTYEKED